MTKDETARREKYIKLQHYSGIEQGDVVEIRGIAVPGQFGWFNSWEPEMTEMSKESEKKGKVYRVAYLTDTGIGIYDPTNNTSDFAFPFYVLNKIENAKIREDELEDSVKRAEELVDRLFAKRKEQQEQLACDTSSKSIPIEEALKMDIPRI